MFSFETRLPIKMCVVNHVTIKLCLKGIALFPPPDSVNVLFARIDFMTLYMHDLHHQ